MVDTTWHQASSYVVTNLSHVIELVLQSGMTITQMVNRVTVQSVVQAICMQVRSRAALQHRSIP